MRNFFKNKIIRVSLFLLFTIISSCNKLVQIETGAGLIASQDIYSSKMGYESAFSGLYIHMQNYLSMTGGGLSSYMSLASDDLTTTSNSSFYQTFYQNTLLSTNSTVNNFWMNSYKGIYRCNLILENLENASFLNEEVKNDFKGQALFIRAFYYFYLIQLFADVPFVLTTNYEASSALGRENSEIILKQLVVDLEVAKEFINQDIVKERAKPNIDAVKTLLARVYLYQKEYAKAIKLCEEVIDSKRYHLESNLNKVFQKGSTETIWQIAYTISTVPEAITFIPATASLKPIYTISDDLLHVFQSDDKRKMSWIGVQTLVGVNYYYPLKYKNLNSLPPTEYAVVFRLSEILLMLAEAKVELNELDEALWATNQIRSRAGTSSLVDVTKEELRQEIIKERRLEFFAEWGQRWLDLKRWNLIDSVLSKKSTWKTYARWLPIPDNELKVNSLLKQNEGYDN